jgi:hypothetical protein
VLIDQWLEPEAFVTWRRRLELERLARNLTPGRRDALVALLSFLGPDGLYPSDETVGKRAGVSARTVRRARTDARALGLLTWQPTRKLVAGRWRQGSNRYEVLLPSRPVCPRPPGGQKVRQRKAISIQRLIGAVPANFPSLAEIARQRLAVIFGDGRKQHAISPHIAPPAIKPPA